MRMQWIGAAALFTLALAGCSSSPGTPTAAPSTSSPAPEPSDAISPPATTEPTTEPTTESPPGRCAAADLRITAYGGDGAAGSAYTGIALTNASQHSCTLSGVPGVRFVDAAGKALPTAARSTGGSGSRFTVKPGGKGYFTIRTVNVADGAEGAPCDPPAAALQVTLSGSSSHVSLAGPFHACQHGSIDVFPLTAKPDPNMHN